MCGIAGYLTHGPANEEDVVVVRSMMRHLAHRGPDGEGLHRDGPMVLGHRRLAIVDLRPEASQPMVNEDGRIALIVNGEVYNFRELRRRLKGRGHRFRSRSDSEVMLHLYEDEGLDFVQMLRGMFALALWDGVERRLVLARDRFGKKPLYYHVGPRGLCFASELQALARTGLFPREPDLEALDAYLALQYVPAAWTAFRGVRKLEPGHLLVCRPGEEPKISRYYSLSFAPGGPTSVEAAAVELRRRIEDAVRVRMVADVPVGAFLSGGIDSTIVVGCMSRLSSQPVRTFSIGFPSGDESELPYARAVATYFGTDHHEMVVEPDMVQVLPKIVEHHGEPFADTSSVPTWYLSRFTREHVTVALSGDAGDEGFGGYKRYRYALVGRTLAGLPRPLRNLAAIVLSRLPAAAWQPVRDFARALPRGEVGRYLQLVGHFPYPDRIRLYHPDLRGRFARDLVADRFEAILARASAQDATGRLMELDFQTYLPDDILAKVDIASMAHALEVRCPLLDQEVVEFAAGLPTSLKLRGWDSKFILKRAMSDCLPPVVARRGKKGFAMPVDRWVREDLREMVRDTLLSRRALGRGLFDPREVARLIEAHDRGESRGLAIWNLLVLETWFRLFVDSP